MYHISISELFRTACPMFKGAAVCAEVHNTPTPPQLWEEIADCSTRLRAQYTTSTIKGREGIAATRLAYKDLGKDPSRYRPACEQLARRILQGKELYSVDAIVDLVNLVSLESGYSTAAIDADKLSGNEILLGVGREGEPYEGIGRGCLNIESLPVYRDRMGAFATPTSDSTRTMVQADTRKLLVLINGYDGNVANLERSTRLTRRLLECYADAYGIAVTYY